MLQRDLEAAESELAKLRDELERKEARLREKEEDVEKIKRALEGVEKERKELGESVTTERFSLQLEVDRLSRDLDRAEDELSRLRAELSSKEAAVRSKEGNLDSLHAQLLELKSELSLQTQARLNLSTKLDDSLATLKAREAELAQAKARVGQLEERLGKDQRALLSAEGVYRDQVTERNTLLLTVYQYLDRVVGAEKVSVSSSFPVHRRSVCIACYFLIFVSLFTVLGTSTDRSLYDLTEERWPGRNETFHEL